MSKKGLTILSAICMFVAAIVFFVMAKNTALGICFAALGVAALVRFFVMKKK